MNALRLFLIVFLILGTTQAKTLCGYDFYSVQIGGGSSDTADTGSLALSGRYNMDDSLDLIVDVAWTRSDINVGNSTDGFGAGLGAEYYFKSASVFTPYLAGSAGWIYLDQSQNSGSDYLWETAGFYGFGLGLELSLSNLVVRPQYNRMNIIGSDYDTIANTIGIAGFYIIGDSFIGLHYQSSKSEAQVPFSEEIDSSTITLSYGFSL